MAEVIDSYSESNYSSDYILRDYYRGQSFENSSGLLSLTKAQFYVKKVGSPTGNMYAYLYEHSGTFGTSSVPTGSPLAVSSAVDISTLTTSYALQDFVFQDYDIDDGYFEIVLGYFDGGASDYLHVGYDSSSSSHAGNLCNSSNATSWTAVASADLCFYVYGEGITPTVGTKYALPAFKL